MLKIKKATIKSKTKIKAVKLKKVLEKPIGKVVHFYNKIKVAVVKFSKPFKAGEKVKFSGATTSFSQVISSLEIDYKKVKTAPKGKKIGIKILKRARVGDEIFKA